LADPSNLSNLSNLWSFLELIFFSVRPFYQPSYTLLTNKDEVLPQQHYNLTRPGLCLEPITGALA